MSMKSRSIDIIDKNPDILGGLPVIAGTRIPASFLKHLLDIGYPDKIISYEYPSLSTTKILAFKKLISEGYNVSSAN